MKISATVLAIIMFCSCTSHYSTPISGGVLRVGDSYSLPQTSFKISVKKSNDGFTYSLTPTQVPDKNFTYTLQSSDNSLFGIKHKTSISNGLLTSVNSNDTGQLDEFLKAVVGAIISPGFVGGGGVSGAPAVAGGGDNAPPIKLTAEEYAELLKGIPNGETSFELPPGHASESLTIPGSMDVLVISVAKGAGSGKPAERTEIDAEVRKMNKRYLAAGSNDWRAHGVLARTLMPVTLTVALKTDPVALGAWREVRYKSLDSSSKAEIERLESERGSAARYRGEMEVDINNSRIRIDKLDLEISALAETIKEAKGDSLTEKQKQLTSLIAVRDALAKQRADLFTQQGKYAGEASTKSTQAESLKTANSSAKNRKDRVSKAPEILASQSFNQAQADDRHVVLIPMVRGLMGVSKNELSLSSGIVTDHVHEMESQGLAFMKIPTTLAKEIVSVPGTLFAAIGQSTKAEKDLYEMQTGMIENQEKRLKAIESLEAKKNAP